MMMGVVNAGEGADCRRQADRCWVTRGKLIALIRKSENVLEPLIALRGLGMLLIWIWESLARASRTLRCIRTEKEIVKFENTSRTSWKWQLAGLYFVCMNYSENQRKIHMDRTRTKHGLHDFLHLCHVLVHVGRSFHHPSTVPSSVLASSNFFGYPALCYKPHLYLQSGQHSSCLFIVVFTAIGQLWRSCKSVLINIPSSYHPPTNCVPQTTPASTPRKTSVSPEHLSMKGSTLYFERDTCCHQSHYCGTRGSSSWLLISSSKSSDWPHSFQHLTRDTVQVALRHVLEEGKWASGERYVHSLCMLL
jgi:hypothetical protein